MSSSTDQLVNFQQNNISEIELQRQSFIADKYPKICELIIHQRGLKAGDVNFEIEKRQIYQFIKSDEEKYFKQKFKTFQEHQEIYFFQYVSTQPGTTYNEQQSTKYQQNHQMPIKGFEQEQSQFQNKNKFQQDLNKSQKAKKQTYQHTIQLEPLKEAPKPTKLSEIKGITLNCNCNIVSNEAELNNLINEIKHAKFIAVDTETTGLRPLEDEMVGMSIAFNTHESYYIPFMHPRHETIQQMDRQKALDILRPILEDPCIGKTLHNAKFDSLFFWNNRINLQGIKFDSQLAANLVKQDDNSINLKFLSEFYLNENMLSYDEVMKTSVNSKNFSEVPVDIAAEYACHDALQTFKLEQVLQDKLNQIPLIKSFFDTIELPLSSVLTKMERKGVLIDPAILKNDATLQLEERMKELDRLIQEAVPKEFFKKKGEKLNIKSLKRIKELLFDHLHLPVVKKTPKGEASTDRVSLQVLANMHIIPRLLLEHRELSQLQMKYLTPLPKHINPKTGRIHTTFKQYITHTGRLSSSNPNLQNIPASGKVDIRAAFIVPPNHTMLIADYNQIDFRVLANLSKDEVLLDAFQNNKDINIQTASQVFNVSLDKVTAEQRQIGKKINFSIVGGISPYGLSCQLGISEYEAKEYVNKFHKQYPGVSRWKKEIEQSAWKLGYVENNWGRRRYIQQMKMKFFEAKGYEHGVGMAINTHVQDTSADILKIAMINIDKEFERRRLKSELLLQIHDELLIEVPDEEIQEVMAITKQQMENVIHWPVPLVVDMHTSHHWKK